MLESVGDYLTIYAEKPWTTDSRAVVVDDDELEHDGLPYMLEAHLAKDAVAALEERRGQASAEERLAAVLHYAERDAFGD